MIVTEFTYNFNIECLKTGNCACLKSYLIVHFMRLLKTKWNIYNKVLFMQQCVAKI